MRVDSASPRTWLLATTAAWAVVSLLLALFAMGGRIAILPEDAVRIYEGEQRFMQMRGIWE